jgi:hypothetical protein
LKTASRLCLLSLIFVAVACAPKKIVMPSYEGRTFPEVLADLNRISSLDATFSIVFEKEGSEIKGDAALDMTSSGDLSLRVYSLGFLALELISKNGIIKSNPSLDRNKILILTEGLKNCLFWWDAEGATLSEADGDFLIQNHSREVWIDKDTFLPKRQNIYFKNGKMLAIYYEGPAVSNGVWYQSQIRLELAQYSATLKIRDIDFKIARRSNS